MGKLRLGRPESRKKMIQVRVTTAEHELLQAEVERRGDTIADLIRDALDHYMSRQRGASGAKGKQK